MSSTISLVIPTHNTPKMPGIDRTSNQPESAKKTSELIEWAIQEVSKTMGPGEDGGAHVLNQRITEIPKSEYLQTESSIIIKPTFVDVLKLWDVTNSRPYERVAIMQYDIEGNPVIFKGRITNVYLTKEGQPMVEIFGGKGSNIAQKILCLKQSGKKLVMEELVLNSHTRATFPLINIRQMIVTQSSESLPEVVGKKTIPLGALPEGEVDEPVLLEPVSNKADQVECFMERPSPTFVDELVHLRGSDEPKTRILQKIETPSAVLMRIASELASQAFEVTAMAYAHQ